jgi:hypothetical protein
MGYDPRTAGRFAFNARRAARPSAPAALLDDATRLATQSDKAAVCAVLLLSFADDDGHSSQAPIPDDFRAIVDKRTIKAYVRPDGAVYRGAFESNGVDCVMVWGDPTTPESVIKRVAELERPALQQRYRAWKLGPFAVHRPSTVFSKDVSL